MTNTFMLAGQDDPEDIIRSVPKGIYAKSFGGGQVDITSGKFVFSATEAYLIEDGKVGPAVVGATLIGNGPDVLTKVTRIGHDLKLDEGIGTCGKAGRACPSASACRRCWCPSSRWRHPGVATSASLRDADRADDGAYLPAAPDAPEPPRSGPLRGPALCDVIARGGGARHEETRIRVGGVRARVRDGEGGGRAPEKWVPMFNGKDLAGWTPKFSGYARARTLQHLPRREREPRRLVRRLHRVRQPLRPPLLRPEALPLPHPLEYRFSARRSR
jgi:hypothetical protein